MRTAMIITGLMITAAVLFIMIEYGQVEEPAQIGVLVTESSRMEKLQGIEDGLADLGFAPEDTSFHVYEEEDDTDALLPLAMSMLDADYNLITAFGGIETQVLQAAMAETDKETPVVFVGMAAPQETGIIERYQAPGGMFTGIANHHLNLSAKRLELFKDALPELEEIVLLYNASIDISERSLRVATDTAEQLNLTVKAFDAGEELDVEALDEVTGNQTGLMTLPSFVIEGMTEELSTFASERSLPLMGIYDDEAAAGFLMSYGSSFYDQGYQAARQISLILQGNDPSAIPVELPDQLFFYVNDEVADRLHLQLNEDVMRLAESILTDPGGEQDAS